MKKQLTLVSLALAAVLANSPVYAAGSDDPLLTKVMLDQFEGDVNNDNATSWAAQAWAGYDLEKLWIKTDGERANGSTESAELQALYSKAVAPYWDLQFGFRQDFKPSPSAEWAVIGFQGLAPYFFEMDSALFIGKEGKTALRVEAEYEIMLTQQWVLSPEIEVNFYGKNDRTTGIGSGLSDIEAGLRLRYEVVREFAPYIGVNWSKSFGNTADFARAEGESTSETQLVLGFRAWF
ncbi:copper resistance protein B [Thalassomonas sp. RHCl1]|uniref:copper resistance protein B n=1 Tax=Thalassomonas sp. RHCl1 TaxID=2995320 RepID=UPI00248BF719|nr:copper resistance protein B [Thalassomonas sp. RHCl1]